MRIVTMICMENENVFQPTINRLSSLVFRQFGCDFDYQSLVELKKQNLATLRINLLSEKPVAAGDWVFFPVFIAGELAGAARISNRENMTDSDLQYLYQVIRLVLEANLNSIERLDILTKYEENMMIQTETPVEKSNLVSLNSYRKNAFPLPNSFGRETMPFAFVIECKDDDDIFKMAYEIHTQSNRFAFFNIADLSVDSFASVDSLRKLGPVTIFVPQLTKLTVMQQNTILQHYLSKPGGNTPHFVCGTHLTLAEISCGNLILPQLLKVLSTGYLAMTNPFSFYKKKRVLDFFFEQGLDSPNN